LEILGRYLIGERDAKKQPSRIAVPALPPTRRHPETPRGGAAGRPGTKYLIQRSAGSGKHELHRLDRALLLGVARQGVSKKVFDTGRRRFRTET
jgi:type I restriction enzyme R subunit